MWMTIRNICNYNVLIIQFKSQKTIGFVSTQTIQNRTPTDQPTEEPSLKTSIFHLYRLGREISYGFVQKYVSISLLY